MKNINRVSVISIFIFLLICSFEAFSEEALVISVIGQAWVRGSAGESWSPIVRGGKISDGQEVKFQEESMIRAVTSGGELRIVQDSGLVTFTQQEKDTGGTSVLNTLNDFVASGGRSRAAATRTLDNPIADGAQDDWIKYIQNPPTLGEIEDFLSLIDYYEVNGKPHRRWALLQRLNANSGNFVGFSQLNNSFEELEIPKLDWQVIVNSGTTSLKAKDGEKVGEGDGIQITVNSDQEVFVYLFFTTKPDAGGIETYKLSPPNIAMVESESGEWEFAGLLSPGDTLSLPNANQSYRLDSNPGHEYVWGWACLGPVVHRDTIDDALSRVEVKLASASADISSTIKKWSPEQCPYYFSMPLEHQ